MAPVVWEDNLPQIVIETVAYGVPVPASDFGGASELCSSDAFKFKGGDEERFFEKIDYLRINEVVEDEREFAVDWLKTALKLKK